jgi:membrane protein implicated in regulation of membrane protease activity
MGTQAAIVTQSPSLFSTSIGSTTIGGILTGPDSLIIWPGATALIVYAMTKSPIGALVAAGGAFAIVKYLGTISL